MFTRTVRINEGRVGLVFRKGDFLKVIGVGKHRIRLSDELKLYDRSQAFVPVGQDLNVLLENESLAEELIIQEVPDQHLMLMYTEGLFTKVLGAGKFAYWKGAKEYRFELIDLTSTDRITTLDTNLLVRRELLAFVRIFDVATSEKGVLLIDGKFIEQLGSGMYYFWRNATPVTVMKTDIRQRQMEISGQEILTKDKAGIRLNFQVLYRVIDVVKALIDVKDFEKQLYGLVQLALREYVGTYTLDELLEKKDDIGGYVMESVSTKSNALGVRLIECGVRDIILPGDMRNIMNQVLIAQKQAQANVIIRREETASTRSLLNTAKLMEDNEMLFKLKEMEFVEKVADKIGEITVGANGQVMDQLRGIFSGTKSS